MPLVLLPLALGCGDDSAGSGGGGAGKPEPEVCDGHAGKAPLSFSQQTPAWGLSGVYGGRVMSSDLNGDAYPDLIVHGVYSNAREQIGSDTRRVFLLMNEAAPGGGRMFVDRTYESGFARPADGSTTELRSAQLAAAADVDGDGDMDILSGTYSEVGVEPKAPADLDRSEIYLNDGSGRFTLLPGSGVQFDRERRTSSLAFVDHDLDGVLDVFVGVHYTATGAQQAPAMYRGLGGGVFEDVSEAWGVTAERRATFGSTVCDLDDDGRREILMSAYARGPNVIFSPALGMEDQGESSGFAYDDNQDFSDNQFFLCWCTVNSADELCAGVPNPAVGCPNPAGGNWSKTSETKPERLGGNTFSTACGDVDGDGKLDLYSAEITHWWAGGSSDLSNLLLNRSDGALAFERADRAASGLEVPHIGVDWNEGGIVSAIADLDLDARADLLLGTSDYPDQYSWIFMQNEDRTFSESGEAIGLHHPCGVGMSVADFDRDGDLDVVVSSGTARDCGDIWDRSEVHFYENDASTTGGNWLAVRLKGGGAGAANTSAVGARVKVTAGGVSQVQELSAGYGHFGLQNDSVLFFALGDCSRAATIEVVWPDSVRSQDRYEEITGNRVVELTQGKSEVVAILPADAAP